MRGEGVAYSFHYSAGVKITTGMYLLPSSSEHYYTYLILDSLVVSSCRSLALYEIDVHSSLLLVFDSTYLLSAVLNHSPHLPAMPIWAFPLPFYISAYIKKGS
jgi:hypothetical protein